MRKQQQEGFGHFNEDTSQGHIIILPYFGKVLKVGVHASIMVSQEGKPTKYLSEKLNIAGKAGVIGSIMQRTFEENLILLSL